jgi:hypothetical protein
MTVIDLAEERLKRDILVVAILHLKTGSLFVDRESTVLHLMSDAIGSRITYETLEATPFVRSIKSQYEYCALPEPRAPFCIEDWLINEGVASFLRILHDVDSGSDVLSPEQRQAASRCYQICVVANKLAVHAGGGSYIIPAGCI